MNTLDPITQEISKALHVEPPPQLEQRLVRRLDELRELHTQVKKKIKTAIALRLGFAFVVVAVVNGFTPRAVLGPVGDWLNQLDHWSVSRHLPEQLLTVHAPTILAALLIVAGLLGRVLGDASHRRTTG